MAAKIIAGYLLLCFIIPSFLPRPWGLVFVVAVFVAGITHLITADHYQKEAARREAARDAQAERDRSRAGR